MLSEPFVETRFNKALVMVDCTDSHFIFFKISSTCSIKEQQFCDLETDIVVPSASFSLW